MIYTCTTNPSLDYYITIPSLEMGGVNRSDMEMFDAGGKGVNVSIVLNNFRIPNVALGFLGGFTKDFYLSYLNQYPNIQPLFTTIADNTRINVKLMDNVYETSINAKGPHITDAEFERFRGRMNSIYTDDYFVLSGNIETEIADRVIDVMRELAQDRVRLILDVDKEILDRCADLKPYAIKLNDKNFEGDLLTVGKEFIEKGVAYVLYSAPQKPSYLFCKEGTLICDNLSDSLVNVTGSADSMVAGFIYGRLRGATSEESFRYANAASLATCMSNDLGSKEKIEDIFDTIQVREI